MMPVTKSSLKSATTSTSTVGAPGSASSSSLPQAELTITSQMTADNEVGDGRDRERTRHHDQQTTEVATYTNTIEAYLESHPEFILKWLEEKAPPEIIHQLSSRGSNSNHQGVSANISLQQSNISADVPNNNNKTNKNKNNNNNNNHNSSKKRERSSSSNKQQQQHIRCPSIIKCKPAASSSTSADRDPDAEDKDNNEQQQQQMTTENQIESSSSVASSSSWRRSLSTTAPIVNTSPRPSATTLAGLTDEEIASLQYTKSKRNSITSDRFQTWLSSSATTSTSPSPSNSKPRSDSYCTENVLAVQGSSSCCSSGGGGAAANNNTTQSPSPCSCSDEGGGDKRNHSIVSICSSSCGGVGGGNNTSAEITRRQSTISESVVNRLEQLGENELFIELVKDISNELNIDILCHKILVNVGYLTQADRCSLFLARGPHEQRYLVAKLFDVTIDSEVEDAITRANYEEIRIPFGIGIAGHVAQTKEIINIKDAYKDSRFNQEVDSQTGYKTSSILALPICNNEGDVIGVAQVINKKTGEQHFTKEDIEVCQRYLIFCGIGIQNAQLFETSVAEYRRNQLLLNLARSIFEEQTSLERLVSKIMKEAQELIKCERSFVYLRDVPLYEASQIEKILMMPPPSMPFSSGERKPLCRRESKTVSMREVLQEKGVHFELVFELTSDDSENEVRRPSGAELQNSPLTQIAKYVATNSEILNIGDAITWYGESVKNSPTSPTCATAQELAIAKNTEMYNTLPKSILCMPIYNGQRQVIGVAQLINKVNNQPFTDSDANTFEAFAIFCGLGIHNTQLYEGACKLMAKQSVALECLSYHATASPEDTERLRRDEIATAAHYNLYSYSFSDFSFTDSETCKATIRMFLELNLVEQFHIPYAVLCRWILSIKKNYRPVKYHNWRHAFNVAQTMFTVLKTGKMEQFLDDRDILGLMVACLCHDLDHRGTNNAFQQLTASPLAVLYSTSTMEHHHFDQCVMILSSEGNNIFQDLSAEIYRKVMKIVEKSILSTDLAMYFRKKDKFIELIENGEIAWQGDDKKELLCGMMMTACDVAAISKPWEIQHKIAKLVADEFFDQGDLEKEQLNQQPVAMMDREKKDELPKMQLSFIDVICLPLYKTLSETFPWLAPLYTGCKANRQNWQDLAEKVDMGLTWIDHDVIEQPVEEFTRDSEPKDIGFVVTTLNCNIEQSIENEAAARRSRSKWKLRRLFRETSNIHKSTSSQLSKTSKDTPSTPPLVIKNDASANNSPTLTSYPTNPILQYPNNKNSATNKTSGMTSSNLTPTKSQNSTTKQSCKIT